MDYNFTWRAYLIGSDYVFWSSMWSYDFDFLRTRRCISDQCFLKENKIDCSLKELCSFFGGRTFTHNGCNSCKVNFETYIRPKVFCRTDNKYFLLVVHWMSIQVLKKIKLTYKNYGNYFVQLLRMSNMWTVLW